MAQINRKRPKLSITTDKIDGLDNLNASTPEVSLTVSTESFARFALMIVFTLVLLLAVHKAAHAILLVFSAFFLTLALNAPVAWVSRHLPGRFRGSRSFATAASFLIVIILLGGFIALIVPPLVKQSENFIHAAPHLVQQLRDSKSGTGKLIDKYHLQKQVNNFSSQLSERLKHIGGAAFSTAQSVGSSIFALLTILVLTFMMLVDGPRYLDFFRDLIPDKHHGTADRLATDMYKVIKGYINGQVLLAAIAALLISPVLLIFHISYVAALIVVIFICGLIPMIGHTIGAVIVTLVALSHSASSAATILVYYLLYQQAENYLIQPRIQANSTNMSPLLVFMSVVIGVSFGGLTGGLVAIPVAGCIRIGVLEYLHSHGIIDLPKLQEATTAKTK